MTNRSDVLYFGAGPARLLTVVLEKAAQGLVNHENTGLGLAEISHRSAIASDILHQAKTDLATYLDIPLDSYEILFMQAGATGQFSATVYNFIAIWIAKKKQRILKEIRRERDTSSHQFSAEEEEDLVLERLREVASKELILDYLVTGSWSLKASQEAIRLLGPEHVNVATDTREINHGKFGRLTPESSWNLSRDAAMVYYCDNETVDGIEFPGFPKCLEPSGKDEDDDPIVVADMSSNILSRRFPIKNFSLIFFGAQKNLGCAGITVVIVKKNLLPPYLVAPEPALMRKLGLPIGPVMLSYETIAKNNSLYNTLSIFDVYIAGQVVKGQLQMYPNDKIDGQEKVSNSKAALIYAALDDYPEIYQVVPEKIARSRMNICFRVTLPNKSLNSNNNNVIDVSEKAFLDGALELGIQGLKGHRSVGGIRASNYNSISPVETERLVTYIRNFAIFSR
ncbi:Phosphoserine aminotransferase [Golovinomyces cichoracearum]|uniref:phosphoserine transaminase n=1 Tax=Golovinomyces cichoracearum TaxID=62708 RepID=A0A420J1L6_9PEZI|nr:Phosphoserine aminotransferase [Golovinomyces cichoracearum]